MSCQPDEMQCKLGELAKVLMFCRIILKSNGDIPIDVWLVSGQHKEQRQEIQQPNGHPSMAAVAAEQQAEMHAPGDSAFTFCGIHLQDTFCTACK